METDGERIVFLNHRVAVLEAERIGYRLSIRGAMDNLGVPGEGYPAPVSEAYRILKEAIAVRPCSLQEVRPCSL